MIISSLESQTDMKQRKQLSCFRFETKSPPKVFPEEDILKTQQGIKMTKISQVYKQGSLNYRFSKALKALKEIIENRRRKKQNELQLKDQF